MLQHYYGLEHQDNFKTLFGRYYIGQHPTPEANSAKLRRKLTFEREWNSDDFISLLFYQGMLSIKDRNLDSLNFKMPNFVIKQLYFQYFYEMILEDAHLSRAAVNVSQIIEQFAQTNDIQP